MLVLRALFLIAALLAANASLQNFDGGELVSDNSYSEELQSGTLFIIDQGLGGSVQITGLKQDVDFDVTIGSLLRRPRPSFLDLSWTRWVDEKIEMLDMLQELLNPTPRCPHMQGDGGTIDTNMVSYLASSRFGPAILTTYAQQMQEEDEGEFDYEEVFIPEEFGSKSYEDASLLEDLSADADKAFLRVEEDPRLLSQQPGWGFFGTNVKTPQDQSRAPLQVIFSTQLDGDSESLQPNVVSVLPMKPRTFDVDEAGASASIGGDSEPRIYAVMDAHQIAGFMIFVLLCTLCIYVWGSLLRSCCKMSAELRASRKAEKQAAQKRAQADLGAEIFAPLLPETARFYSDIEYASSHTPDGLYFAPQGERYVTVAVPLINGELK